MAHAGAVPSKRGSHAGRLGSRAKRATPTPADSPRYTPRQLALLAAPPLVFTSMLGTYRGLSRRCGPRRGYFAAFLVYWLGWCLLFPLWVIGPGRLRPVLVAPVEPLGRPPFLGALLLAGPPLGSALTGFRARVRRATPLMLLASAGFALVNGAAEELLWRGIYLAEFPRQPLVGYLYPSLGFGAWHLAPQSVRPSHMPGGRWAFAATAVFMGLTYGWVARRTGSIRWTVVSHMVTDFFGLGGVELLGM